MDDNKNFMADLASKDNEVDGDEVVESQKDHFCICSANIN